ncbi:MAG: peptidoglycan binding domain-containing protein, partial [Anaerotignum sp.]|nr:peptidoglycan binding domain-containing protein [Anaerotignum sp.]
MSKGPRMSKRSGSSKAVIAVVVVAAAVAVFFGYHHIQKGKIQELLSAEGIYQGVTIDGADVAGLSEAEALQMLQDKYKTEIDGQVLTLYYEAEEDAEEVSEEEPVEEMKWEIPFAEIGAGYDVEGAVKTAYETGRAGTEEENFKVGKELLKGTIDIEVPYTYDDALMDAKLAEIAEEFDREAEDSTVTRKNGKFIITEEKDGL